MNSASGKYFLLILSVMPQLARLKAKLSIRTENIDFLKK
jgi:hypothetical protein